MLECRILADGAVVHGIKGVGAWSNLGWNRSTAVSGQALMISGPS